MLLRKGIFTRLNTGIDGHNLDEMLIALVSTDTSASDHSERWFNSKPGDTDSYFDDVEKREYHVDMHEEFCATCELANIAPEEVRAAVNRVIAKIKEEDNE
jgi:hypothetical protein